MQHENNHEFKDATLTLDMAGCDFFALFPEIDDAGLSASEFRVYCHYAATSDRSDKHAAEIPEMAKICRLSEKRCVAALAELYRRRIIVEENETITLTEPEEWIK